MGWLAILAAVLQLLSLLLKLFGNLKNKNELSTEQLSMLDSILVKIALVQHESKRCGIALPLITENSVIEESTNETAE